MARLLPTLLPLLPVLMILCLFLLHLCPFSCFFHYSQPCRHPSRGLWLQQGQKPDRPPGERRQAAEWLSLGQPGGRSLGGLGEGGTRNGALLKAASFNTRPSSPSSPTFQGKPAGGPVKPRCRLGAACLERPQYVPHSRTHAYVQGQSCQGYGGTCTTF